MKQIRFDEIVQEVKSKFYQSKNLIVNIHLFLYTLFMSLLILRAFNLI
mgnify:CR=1 FL=1